MDVITFISSSNPSTTNQNIYYENALDICINNKKYYFFNKVSHFSQEPVINVKPICY